MAAEITSTSCSVAALPLTETTQMPPAGTIDSRSAASGSRSAVEFGAQEDEVRIRLGATDRDVGPAVRQQLLEPRLVEADDGDAVARPDAELVDERAGADEFGHATMIPRDTLRAMPDGPLLVFGPASPTYDFGPAHPLTPRRFGPGIDLLRSLGAVPGLAPTRASEIELRWVHTQRYIDVVKRLSVEPFGPSEAGFGQGGDDPPFPGMHEAAAAVAGGSIAAVEAILSGEVEHAFHPGGGLHHAMPARASGFCIYDDPALAIARARQAGRRVLYLDFDVHHGDGVQAINAADPGVMTVSFHELGRYLFPGTGFTDELGDGEAAGTVVNVPFEPPAGEGAWLAGVRALVPLLAAAFGPDLVVSQHGADSHAWDPLAHLRVTTTAMGEAARLTDAVAHRHAGGMWLATGGGGYDAYRVVPRSWSLVWLAEAHREPPDTTPAEWRDRWAAEAARYRQSPLPERFLDEPNAGLPIDDEQRRAESRSLETIDLVRALAVPLLLRVAEEAGWWSPANDPPSTTADRAGSADSEAASRRRGLPDDRRAARCRATRAPGPRRAGHPAGGSAGRAAGARAGGRGRRHGHRGRQRRSAGRCRDRGIGRDEPAGRGCSTAGRPAPRPRRRARVSGPGSRARAARCRRRCRSGPIAAEVGVADRDPIEPWPYATRLAVARRLLEGAGFTLEPASGAIGDADPGAIVARRG